MRGYDNPHWEFHLPINPPINPGTDIDVNGDVYMYDMGFNGNGVSIVNWDDDGYLPRLRESVIEDRAARFDFEDEFEQDWGYDCD